MCVCVCVCVRERERERERERAWVHQLRPTCTVLQGGEVVTCPCPPSIMQADSPAHSDASPTRHKGWVGSVMGGPTRNYAVGLQAKKPVYSSSRKSAAQFKPPTLVQHGKFAH